MSQGGRYLTLLAPGHKFTLSISCFTHPSSPLHCTCTRARSHIRRPEVYSIECIDPGVTQGKWPCRYGCSLQSSAWDVGVFELRGREQRPRVSIRWTLWIRPAVREDDNRSPFFFFRGLLWISHLLGEGQRKDPEVSHLPTSGLSLISASPQLENER